MKKMPDASLLGIPTSCFATPVTDTAAECRAAFDRLESEVAK